LKLIDPIELRLDAAMLTSIEVPFHVAQTAVPQELSPIELRPGLSLAALIFFRVSDGCPHAHMGALPAYDELILAFQVVPSMRRLLPRMSLFVESMTTSLESANEFLEDVHWIPAVRCALASEIDRSGMSVRISDERGPILEMANREPSPTFVAKETAGQVFTRKDGRAAVYHEMLIGTIHEHQTRKAHVQLFEHPFLAALNGVPRTPRTYIQMWAQPGVPVRQSAERPEWV
jgi:hypothetical protein